MPEPQGNASAGDSTAATTGTAGDGTDAPDAGVGTADGTDAGPGTVGGDGVDALPTPPGPNGWPLLGNTVSFVRGPFEFYDVLAAHGDVVGYTIGTIDFVVALHPDHVEQVLLDDHGRFSKWTGEEYLNLHFAPEGLVFTEGEQWRRQRNVIQDAFTLERVRSHAGTMREYAGEMVAGWDDGAVVALNEAFPELTLRVLAHTLLDVDVEQRGEVVRDAMQAVNERADARNVSNFLPSWVPTPSNRRFERAVRESHALVDALIAERRGSEDEYDDLLSLLLTAEGPDGGTLSETEVRDQMITFLGAGTDTTALALTYACLEVATNEDVRRRLDEEHERVLGGDAPTLEDLDALAYTEQVIKETLRLYPPAYVMFREAAEDVDVGGYRVPEGTKISLPQFYVQTDDRWFEDPESFRPERWTDDREAELPDYAYFPFGGGPRHCVGMRFAMLELKTVLPTVLQAVEFDLVSDPDPEFTLGITLKPEEDVRVRVAKR